ncbi:MAG: hypothetical protein L0387_34550 [Acidobacteria bacterium]|nr:hypothetical protein [Acidobacteriota bacterium]
MMLKADGFVGAVALRLTIMLNPPRACFTWQFSDIGAKLKLRFRTKGYVLPCSISHPDLAYYANDLLASKVMVLKRSYWHREEGTYLRYAVRLSFRRKGEQ